MSYENIDEANPYDWSVQFFGVEDVIFSCKGVTIPGISSDSERIKAPGNPYSIPAGAGALTFDDLELEFIVDSEFNNFKKINDWIRKNSNNSNPSIRDFTLSPMKNNGLMKPFSFNFIDARPISLSGLSFLIGPGMKETRMVASMVIRYELWNLITRDTF